MTRQYILYVPPSYNSSKQMPLIFVFHGYSGTPEFMLSYTDMADLADTYDFIVAVPKGTGSWNALSWNAGSCCGYASSYNVDDVTFVSDMIDMISSGYCIDPARIFATGFSNGGMMSYRLACELSDRIAAVAPVAGDIRLAECNPPRPVPGIAFHGTADAVIPYSWALASVDASADFNQCSDETEVVYQYGEVTCVAYKGCAQEATVEFCTIAGGGHNWPGAIDLCLIYPDSCEIYGHTTQHIDASLAMWQFFTAHAMPGDTAAMSWIPLLLFDGP
jgi:polyhydroxybutyrate depolymerase